MITCISIYVQNNKLLLCEILGLTKSYVGKINFGQSGPYKFHIYTLLFLSNNFTVILVNQYLTIFKVLVCTFSLLATYFQALATSVYFISMSILGPKQHRRDFFAHTLLHLTRMY